MWLKIAKMLFQITYLCVGEYIYIIFVCRQKRVLETNYYQQFRKHAKPIRIKQKQRWIYGSFSYYHTVCGTNCKRHVQVFTFNLSELCNFPLIQFYFFFCLLNQVLISWNKSYKKILGVIRISTSLVLKIAIVPKWMFSNWQFVWPLLLFSFKTYKIVEIRFFLNKKKINLHQIWLESMNS